MLIQDIKVNDKMWVRLPTYREYLKDKRIEDIICLSPPKNKLIYDRKNRVVKRHIEIKIEEAK